MESGSVAILFWVMLAFSATYSNGDDPLVPCIFETCQCFWHMQHVLVLNVVCENANKTQATPGYFPSMTENATNYTVNSLLIRNYDFKQIPEKAFDGLILYELDLANNGLEVLANSAFDGVKNLLILSVMDEANLQTIEPEVFDTLKNLAHLELDNVGLNDDKYASFLPGVSKLDRLARLALSKNPLTKIDSNSFKGLNHLSELVLDGNQLVDIAPDTFAENIRLGTFHAAGNKFQDLEPIFKAIKQKIGSGVGLWLDGNKFVNLKTSTVLSSISTLSLTNNQLEAFDTESLAGTNAITTLDLSGNKISRFDDARLQNMTGLYALRLSNNLLSKVPSIASLQTIVFLDMSSQNGQLSTIQDYAFDRDNIPLSMLEINLSGNNLSFGTQAFCSRNYNQSYITAVKFSFENMKSIPKCVIKQLSAKPRMVQIHLAKPEASTTDYSEVCNCDLLLFTQLYGFAVTGVCETVFPTLKCDNSTYRDPCKDQLQYECSQSETTSTSTVATTTTTTLTTQSTTTQTTVTSNMTSTTTSSGSLNSTYFYFSFLLALFVVLAGALRDF